MKTVFIEKIYEETIKQVLKDVPINYHEELKINYKNNLIQSYKKIKVDETNIEKKLANFIPLELSYWNDLSLDVKLSLLIKDKVYNEIIFISNYGLKMAQKKLDEGVLLEPLMAQSYVKRIEELLKTVKSFNKERAAWFLSEARLDFLYASGLIEEKSSRLYHTRHKKINEF